MAKKISILPANEIELEFSDGVVLKATFNMLAVTYMQEVLNAWENEKITMLEFGSIILYGAIKANHQEYTLEEARKLAILIAPIKMQEIISEYMESMGELSTGALGEAQKKTLMNMLLKLAN